MNDRDINLIKLQIDSILANPKPYQLIPNLPLLQEQLKAKIADYVETARQTIVEQVEGTLVQKKEKAPYQPTGVHEKPTRALREKELYHLFFNTRQQITTLNELDDAIKHLRTKLMEQLKVSNLKKSD